jgi:hypothetical protein
MIEADTRHTSAIPRRICLAGGTAIVVLLFFSLLLATS